MHLVYSELDWVTATTNNNKIGMVWYTGYLDWKAKLGKDAKVSEKQFHNGYYHGIECEGFRWGYSENLGYFLQASGKTAKHAWLYLYPAKHRITRLDLCCDYLIKPRHLATEWYNHLIEFGVKKSHKFSRFTGGGGGETLYLGSRQSPQYGRLYDKGIQSGQAPVGELWRMEVEYKKPVAGFLAQHLMTLDTKQRQTEIANRVVQWFLERGCPVDKDWQSQEVKPIFVEERITTSEKKLAWLRGQVAPTVSRLIEAGLGKEVLNCLLLDERQVLDILREERGE